ncbi:hypothetical protein [Pseudomonas sp. KNUC1026]|uniref:hypothetical protein n=1 Tax=Pseudomonas sp. KNUC1026 TaxID=2893890 RepID=UPI001F4785B5|nr:hypothetical protein [Pseudomonas sp. KNUC1026]UFH48284.1 hypothetical protein LN139_14030 [Pseudomonas sp. KNUC1026]
MNNPLLTRSKLARCSALFLSIPLACALALQLAGCFPARQPAREAQRTMQASDSLAFLLVERKSTSNPAMDCRGGGKTDTVVNGTAWVNASLNQGHSSYYAMSCTKLLSGNQIIKLSGKVTSVVGPSRSAVNCPASNALISVELPNTGQVLIKCQALDGYSLQAESASPATQGAAPLKENSAATGCADGSVATGILATSDGDRRFGGGVSCKKVTGGTVTSGGGLYLVSKQSDSPTRTCAEAVVSNSVMTARAHWGDENDATVYGCARQWQNSSVLELVGDMQSSSGTESDHTFACSTDYVLVGMGHTDDENGTTYYQCSKLKNTVFDVTSRVFESRTIVHKENESEMDCSPGIIIARHHKGDETKNSTVTCGDIF